MTRQSFDSWLAAVESIAGGRFPEFREWYSFETAYDGGMTPQEAEADCREWLDA